MKLFGYLFGVSMAMVHLNYTDNLPDGGLLLDIIQEQVLEILVAMFSRE